MAGNRLRLLLIFMLINRTTGLFVNKNVVFQRVNQMATTPQQWLLTAVVDVSEIKAHLDTVSRKIDQTIQTNTKLLTLFHDFRDTFYDKVLRRIQDEIRAVQENHNVVVKTFEAFSPVYNRQKRSLLPFIGQALSTLFGVVDEDHINSIRTHVNILSKNQQKMAHVVEDSITIINITRNQVAENRKAINTVIDKLSQLESEFRKQLTKFHYYIMVVRKFVEIESYFRLTLQDVSVMAQRSSEYAQHLQTLITTLSMGRLPPDIITPGHLQSILLDIQRNLPSSFGLAWNPEQELWAFYQHLKCTTIMHDQLIIMTIPIPLINFKTDFEIFRVFNLPMVSSVSLNSSDEQTSMTATYELEADVIAVNKLRTKFTLLTNMDWQKCTGMGRNFCNFENPVYQANMNQFCVMALFFNQTKRITRYCRTMINLKAKLPTAVNLGVPGIWAVVTDRERKFAVVCKNLNLGTWLANPPIAVIRLNDSCSATSDIISLPPFSNLKSKIQLVDPTFDKMVIKEINGNQTELWAPLQRAIPLQTTHIKLPEKLREINDIPMHTLLKELELENVPELHTPVPVWVWVLVAITTTLAIGIGILIIRNCLLQKAAKMLIRRSNVHEPVDTHRAAQQHRTSEAASEQQEEREV